MKIKFYLQAMIAVFCLFQTVAAQKVTEVDSKQVNKMLQKDTSLVVLDVRTADEFNQGHIRGAKNIDILKPEAYSELDKLDHNAKYIVHCRTHKRSDIAVDYMTKHGFKHIYQMKDGSSGWNDNDLPVER